MKKWEYNIQSTTLNKISKNMLDQWGEDGWELVLIYNGYDRLTVVFKREIVN